MKIDQIIHKLHIYAGFLLFLPLLLFAVSGFMLNHRWPLWETWDERVETERQVSASLPPDGSNLEKARDVLAQLGVQGEINLVVLEPGKELLIRAHRPGGLFELKLDPDTGQGTLKQTELGFAFVLRNLHTLAGLHSNLAEKKNWGWTRAWSLTMDLSAVAMVLLLITGLYMWFKQKSLHRAGGLLLGTGGVVFLFLYIMLVC